MKKEIIIDPDCKTRQIAGYIDNEKIYQLIGVWFHTIEVEMYPGFIKHCKKKHPGIFEKYYQLIPEIIFNPDYIGKNPKETKSIEMYKRVDETLLLAIKLDPHGYLYLSSFYELNNAEFKIQKRLRKGRIVPYK